MRRRGRGARLQGLLGERRAGVRRRREQRRSGVMRWKASGSTFHALTMLTVGFNSLAGAQSGREARSARPPARKSLALAASLAGEPRKGAKIEFPIRDTSPDKP